MDFGPVVKPLDITVKKEAGEVVETSDVVKPQATKSIEKGARAPGAQKWPPKKGGPKEFSKFWDFRKF